MTARVRLLSCIYYNKYIYFSDIYLSVILSIWNWKERKHISLNLSKSNVMLWR